LAQAKGVILREPNYSGARKRKEEARRKKQEEKRNRRLNKPKDESPEAVQSSESPV
jgi:hypothetical protein